ncbi:MAG: putative esterase, partial [Gemmatimonadetes bacterium]|nr:putative esterase [Gemmatimonadota bacterium]
AGGVVLRAGAARRTERAYATRRPPAADGIVPGAEGFTLAGTNGRALLMLHGSGDTPQTLRYLAGRLHAAGFTVRAPLLPGHGRGLRDFAAVSAEVYLRTAGEELEQLCETSGWVGIVGLSMGGAIAARLAAERRDVRLLVLLAPYLAPRRSVALVGRAWTLWSLVLPYLGGRGGGLSIHDPVARSESFAYGVFPPRAVRALVDTASAARRALPAITVPTLVVNSEEDNRIPRSLAESATATLRAPTERRWVAGCGHVITVDYCRDAVAALVLDFLARHAD